MKPTAREALLTLIQINLAFCYSSDNFKPLAKAAPPPQKKKKKKNK